MLRNNKGNVLDFKCNILFLILYWNVLTLITDFTCLFVAETHAGDDRSDAGTDEDEIGRLRGSEQKGSTGI